MKNIRVFTHKNYGPESRHDPLFFGTFLVTISSRKKPTPQKKGVRVGVEGRWGGGVRVEVKGEGGGVMGEAW